MRQLTYVSPGIVEWQDGDEPTLPDQGAALVRPLAVARCDLDPVMAELGLFPGPFAVGHETVAEVVGIGDDVTEHRVGDRVLVPFQVSCGACGPCRGTRFAACDTYRAPAGAAFGFGPAGGGHGGAMSDLLAVPHADHLLIAAPGDLPAATLATLPDNVLDGFRAVAEPLAARPGADVLVVAGAGGSIPLYAVASAIALGAGSVRFADRDGARLAAATALGAEVVEIGDDWPRRFAPAAITVDATSDPDGLMTTIRSTERYGTCTSVAIYFAPTTPLPMLEMYTRGITLHTSRVDARRLLPEVIHLVAANRLDPTGVPTTVLPWDDAAEAWLEPAIKLVVERA